MNKRYRKLIVFFGVVYKIQYFYNAKYSCHYLYLGGHYKMSLHDKAVGKVSYFSYGYYELAFDE